MQKETVLIVEDEILIAEDLQELLVAMNYKVQIAHNYEQAIQIADRYNPQIVFCDIYLGEGLNGIDVITSIKQKHPHIEFVLITAMVTEDIVKQAEIINPFSFIVKPFNENQIRVTSQLLSSLLKSKTSNQLKTNILSTTEQKVLHLIAQQKNSKEIADLLFISEKTVRNHRYNISKKLLLPNTNNSLLKWAITHYNEHIQ